MMQNENQNDEISKNLGPKTEPSSSKNSEHKVKEKSAIFKKIQSVVLWLDQKIDGKVKKIINNAENNAEKNPINLNKVDWKKFDKLEQCNKVGYMIGGMIVFFTALITTTSIHSKASKIKKFLARFVFASILALILVGIVKPKCEYPMLALLVVAIELTLIWTYFQRVFPRFFISTFSWALLLLIGYLITLFAQFSTPTFMSVFFIVSGILYVITFLTWNFFPRGNNSSSENTIETPNKKMRIVSLCLIIPLAVFLFVI